MGWTRRSQRLLLEILLASIAMGEESAGAVPVTSRTSNISSPEITQQWGGDFIFGHRFQVIGSKVINSPTFTLEIGILNFLEIGARYASASDVGDVNEGEPFFRVAILEQKSAPIDLSFEGAYNTAATSFDGAIVLRRKFFDLVSLAGAARAFSDGYKVGGLTAAFGIGAQIHITRYLSVIGDMNKVLAAEHDQAIGELINRFGWSGGIAVQIPYTPHSLSLIATNGNTQTLEGMSRGTNVIRFGFEFEILFADAKRWAAIFSPPEEQPAPAQKQTGSVSTATSAATPGAPTTEIPIQGYAYLPETLTIPRGATVRWINKDRVRHTSTSRTGLFDSGDIAPGGSWARRFDQPGRYPYFCSLHPYMTGEIVVQ